jgi:cytochrome c oxidase subunit 3
VSVVSAPVSGLLGEQYRDLEQQRRTATLGMWVFLATELMLFGGLFAGYTVLRVVYPAAWAEGSHHMALLLGGVNTAVLIVSSVTMALAVHGARAGERGALLRYLVATALLGTVFMVIKGVEYVQHYQEGLVPGLAWRYDGPYPDQVKLFVYVYFVITGLHAIHLTVAIAFVLIVLVKAWRGAFPPAGAAPVEVLGLYWHFVDCVWIFLLPLIYLVGTPP